MNTIKKLVFASIVALTSLAGGAAAMAQTTSVATVTERGTFIPVGTASRPPIGWVEFCRDNTAECATRPSAPRDVVLNRATWREMVRINALVNQRIEPVTDADQFGVAERWTYPDTGRGDCEDYVLLKRRLLIEAGFPREALLITVVRDKIGDGHAVLTVRTSKGEYVLDNQETEVLPWQETGYRFIKRQSQSDPNLWVSLGDGRTISTAGTR
jgi:predicted transglutaminase-like cysteine proteinase